MKLTVEKNDPLNGWDVELSKYSGSLFLSHTWLQAISGGESEPVYLKFLADNKLIGLIAGMIRPFGKGNKKQLFFYSGPVCVIMDPLHYEMCRKALLDYAKANGFQRLTIQSNDVSCYFKTSLKNFIMRERSEFYFDLSVEYQDFESQIRRDIRRKISKAKKNDLKFGFGYSDELLDSLLMLMKSTFDIRLSKDYDNYDIFSMAFCDREVMRKLLENRIATLYYVSFGDEIVSIQFVVAINHRAYGIYMGTNALGYKLEAPSLLYYQIAHICKQKGFHIYNIGGVPPGEKNKGIREYKKNFGAKTVHSCVEKSYFLLFPLQLLNVLFITRRVLNKRINLGFNIPWIIKKPLIKIYRLFLKDRDQY